jgi:hypothetical protein
VKVGDLVRIVRNMGVSSGMMGIILVVDTDMVKIANHGWWTKQYVEVISEQKIRNR